MIVPCGSKHVGMCATVWYCTINIYRNVSCILLVYLLHEQSPSWEENRFSASQEIPRILWNPMVHYRRSEWPRGLRRRSVAARLLRLWVWIPPGCLSVLSVVLSGRGLCDELMTRPEKSYRLWCVVVFDQETSLIRGLWPTGGLLRQEKKKVQYRVHKCPPLAPILIQLDPLHTPTSNFLKISFNIILPPTRELLVLWIINVHNKTNRPHTFYYSNLKSYMFRLYNMVIIRVRVLEIKKIYLNLLWLFYLVCILYCGSLTCFVMCGLCMCVF
jgi:hypothetical protein